MQMTFAFLRRLALTGAAMLLLAAAPNRAHGSITLTLTETGGNVVLNGVGSVNLTSLSLVSNTATFPANIYPTGAGLFVGPAITTTVSTYGGVTGPASFGPGNETPASTGTGSIFGVYGTGLNLYVPVGYVSGTTLTGSSTFNNATFASLGFTPGTYVYTWGAGASADSLTITSVPEPSVWGMMAVGAGGLGVMLRRRRA